MKPEYIEEFGCFIKIENGVLLSAPAINDLNPDYKSYEEDSWSEITDPAEGFSELIEEIYGIKTRYNGSTLIITEVKHD
jgi:hypothetical protein